jgi:hypothetical protein
MGLPRRLPQPVRASYIDNAAAEAIVDRALGLRADVQAVKPERVKMFNLVEDVRAVWPLGDEALWLERILPHMAEVQTDVCTGRGRSTSLARHSAGPASRPSRSTGASRRTRRSGQRGSASSAEPST